MAASPARVRQRGEDNDDDNDDDNDTIRI